jgi:hypothetical protein
MFRSRKATKVKPSPSSPAVPSPVKEGDRDFEAMAKAVCDSATAVLGNHKTTKNNKAWKDEFAHIIAAKRAASEGLNIIKTVFATVDELIEKKLSGMEKVEELAI